MHEIGMVRGGGAVEVMGRWMAIIVACVVVLLLIGAGLYLAFGDFPAPTKPVEKTLPNERFPR